MQFMSDSIILNHCVRARRGKEKYCDFILYLLFVLDALPVSFSFVVTSTSSGPTFDARESIGFFSLAK